MHDVANRFPERPGERPMTDAEEVAAKMVERALMPDPEPPRIVEGDGIRAGYKMEITFGPGRSSLRDYGALVSLWESGKHFHGGGDANMYWCFDCRAARPKSATKRLMAILDGKERADVYGCGNPIPNGSMGGGMALCPNCHHSLNTDQLTGQLPFFGPTQELAAFVARYFHVLKSNADIYCKYHPTDIRYQAMEKAKGLEKARQLRGLFIYPLRHILKDVGNGASLESRFAAFFNA